MITDSLLEAFVRALATHKHVDRGTKPNFDWEKAGVPVDVGRVLGSVGGWSSGNLKFTEPSRVDAERQLWNRLVGEFEAGRSDISNHALWNSAWYPLATSSVEVHAFDPIGCFGGAPGQVVVFDVKGGDSWRVFPAISSWITALTEGLESEEKDAVAAALTWARANRAFTEVKLPQAVDEQRSSQRFEAGVGAWIELRQADGRCWAIRERRDGYELRIGEGDDAVIRKRICPKPSAEVRRLVREQKAEGFGA